MLGTSFQDNYFAIINGFTRTHTASHTLVQDNLNDDYNANDKLIKPYEHQLLDELAFLLFILVLLEEQKFDRFSHLILSTTASDTNAGLYEGGGELLLCPHPSIARLQQIVIPHILRAGLCSMAQHQKLAGYHDVTLLHAIPQHTCYWPLMGANVTSSVRDCVRSAKIRVRLRKNASLLNSFPAFDPSESVAIDILRPLPKCQHGFQHIIVIAD